MSTVEKPTERKKRGSYAVSARLQRALLLLASGQAKTQVEACTQAGITTRALQLALRRESVRKFMVEQIMGSLSISAMKAAKVLDDLMVGSSNEMVRYHSARHALATAFGIAPPSKPGVAVNIHAPGAGYLIDLRGNRSAPLTATEQEMLADVTARGCAGAVLGGDRQPPLIEGKVVPTADGSAPEDFESVLEGERPVVP